MSFPLYFLDTSLYQAVTLAQEHPWTQVWDQDGPESRGQMARGSGGDTQGPTESKHNLLVLKTVKSQKVTCAPSWRVLRTNWSPAGL